MNESTTTAAYSGQAPAPPRAERFSLHLRVSERRLLLSVVDLSAINAALLLALYSHPETALPPGQLLSVAKWFITLGVIWLACAAVFNLYHLPLASHAALSVRTCGSAALVTVALYALTPWLTPPLFSRGLLLIFAVAAVSAISLWRLLYASVLAQPWSKERALVVGAGQAGRSLAQDLQMSAGAPNPYRGAGYTLVGYIDDNPDYRGQTVAGLPVLDGHHALLSVARAWQVNEIILAITHRHAIADSLFDALIRCTEAGYRVTTLPVFYERVLGRIPVEHLGRNLDTLLQMQEGVGYRSYQLFRRLADLILVLPGLLLLGLAIPAVLAANALTSPGPLFYRQTRVGRGGAQFAILKFRSMVPDAEQQTGAVWARANDDRITPFGRFMRRSRLDELPQVINILRGEMSFIGPRPERPEFVDSLAHAIPFYRARHAVRPGLTGWAQVQYQYGDSTADARIKLEYDLYYVKHITPWLDLQILFRTLAVVLQLRGR
mgnify:CR=1 FL=1